MNHAGKLIVYGDGAQPEFVFTCTRKTYKRRSCDYRIKGKKCPYLKKGWVCTCEDVQVDLVRRIMNADS